MSTSTNQMNRFVLFSFVTVSMVCVANAQSTERSDKDSRVTQRIVQPACPSEVRPIQRTTKPAKLAALDWTTLTSTYTHDQGGQRVDQFALAVEPQSMERADFVKSGYRHTRSTLQAGFSSDNYHLTEQWGQPVRPYGEWRYPNRPFSVPYGQWGPQLPQVVVGGNQWNGFGPMGMNPGMQNNTMGNLGAGVTGPNMSGPNSLGGNWQSIPGGNGNANSPWSSQGMGTQGGFGVGPGNVLPAGQDEYYQQAPTYHPMPGGSFQSPYRN